MFDVGDIFFNRPVTTQLEVRNTGRASISLTSLSVDSGDADVSETTDTATTHAFRIQFTPTIVSPGATVELPVTVSRPAGTGDVEDLAAELTLTATGTERDQGVASIHLRARAVKDGCDTPQALEFGVVGVDDSLPLTVTSPNLTRAPRASPQPVLESEMGDHLAFKVQSARSPTEAGAVRNVVVAFRPTEARNYSAHLRLKAFDDCEERVIELRGTGAENLLLWDAKTSFGFVPVGLSKTSTITIKNIGPGAATLSNFSFKDDASFSFASAPPEAVVVPARGELSLELRCSPTTVGPHNGALDFETGLRQQPAGRIVLSCYGGGPDIEVQPSLLNFGKVAFVSTATTPIFQSRRITVLNAGTPGSAPPDPAEALHLGKSGVMPYFAVVPGTGTDVDEFELALDGPYDPVKGLRGVAGQNQLPIRVKLTPRSAGMKEADVVIYSNDLDEPEVKVHVVANAVEYPPCKFSLTPHSVNFGRLATYEERELKVKLTNLGQLPDEKCLVSALDLAPGSNSAFSLPDGPVASRELLPGERMTVRVRAAPVGPLPTSPSLATGSIRFFVNSPSTPEVTVPVSMEIGSSCLAAFPDRLEFGSVAVGCARTKSLQLRNICSRDIYLTAESIKAGSSDFAVVSAPSIPPGGLLLRPGLDHPEFLVRFTPQSVGASQATFGIDVKEDGSAVSVVNLVSLHATGAITGVQTDTFTQGGGPVDILFNETTENCYFLSNMARVSQRMPVFLQYLLDAQVDFHFGVTTFEEFAYCDSQAQNFSWQRVLPRRHTACRPHSS